MATTAEKSKEKFSIKHLPKLLKQTFKAWNNDDPFRLSAIVAYYAVLSLPGLLILIINTVGAIWGTEIVQGKLTGEISDALGASAAQSIKDIIESTRGGNKSLISTILGIATLVFGATGVFYHLQLSLNNVWGIKQDADSGIKKVIKDRLLGFGFVLVIGFLLLISFIVSTMISLLNGYLQSFLPEFSVYAAFVFSELLSLAVITVLFALLFKFLPDAKIKWRSIWVGAILTAVLFTIGKFLLGLYFGKADPSSTYGAAGSMVLILLWVSYSCLILFFGAEFTWVYAKKYGFRIEPNSSAVLIGGKEEEEKEKFQEKKEALKEDNSSDKSDS
ncbi:YihY/virulence factor BrkB family protein [Cryomorpha ignava]|uniref:YihY/virulence factor BrkB family protein n=1 Tax=Cryomorpha ignava TaxID=101383 RepID=A0A7K3WV07_9FLAO|nr:YihY/virulence factor BrkB family protein [Cryomorpha ignava]NEN25487.1 YihY/virulence factor BrkB family protein [Cryomorpha ignava]